MSISEMLEIATDGMNLFIEEDVSSTNHGVGGKDAAPGKENEMDKVKQAIEAIKALFADPEAGDKDGKLAYNNPIEFIDGIMDRPALIQRGNDGSLLLTGKAGLNHTVAIKLEPGNGFYKVTTLMPRQKIDNKKTVWEAALPLRENSRTTGEIGSAKEPSGPNGTISIANKNPKIKAQNAKTDPNAAAFKKWFKNSKVVDEKGNPLVVYHGTNADFAVFIPSQDGALGQGMYFAASKEYAQGVGNRRGGWCSRWGCWKSGGGRQ